MKNNLPITAGAVAAHKESGYVFDILTIASPSGNLEQQIVVYTRRRNNTFFYREINDFDEKFLILEGYDEKEKVR